MYTGSKDLISSLPDALVCHILSFLSTEDAALTSVLSKRWRYLLACVPVLDLDDAIYDHPNLSERRRQQLRRIFMVFVDRVMALQGNAPINKFTLRYEVGDEPSRVHLWISNVLDRDVVDFELYFCPDCYYPLPSKVFMSKTLVRLKVSGTDEFTFDVGEVSLPKLKSLHIDDAAFEDSGAAFSKLISSCPVLEELVMDEVYWDFWESFSVSNSSLKRLKICCDFVEENPKSVSFDTPNVVYLEFTDTVAVKYPKVNFGSLVEASVDLRTTLNQNEPAGDSADATGFFIGICNVKILYLSANTIEVLTICCKPIPVFEKLYHLTIESDSKVGWEPLPYLLEKCPNLETLVFERLHYKDTDRLWDNDEDWCAREAWDGKGIPICKKSSSLVSSPVKILKILKFGEVCTNFYNDMDRQIRVIRYFLETMPNLEQVMLHYNCPFDESLSTVSTELRTLGKVASMKCKIQVISSNISFSSTLHSSSPENELVFFKNTFPV